MSPPVPYLARLARQAAGQPMLRPPRRLFDGDIYLPARSPDRPGTRGPAVTAAGPGRGGPFLPGTDEDPAAPEQIAPSRGEETGSERPELQAGPAAHVQLAPGATFAATPARPEQAEVRPPAPGSPDAPWPPRTGSRSPHAVRPALPPASGPADPADARPAAPPTGPWPSGRLRPADDTGGAWPGSGVSAPRAGSADLTGATGLALPPGEAQGRTVPPTGTGPAPSGRARSAPAPAGREPDATTGSRQVHRTDDAGPLAAHGTASVARATGAGPDRPAEPVAVRNLIPPTADLRPAAMPGSEPGEPRPEPRGAGRPQVSIGTIEVTVIPPAPATPQVPFPAPVSRSRPRPPSGAAARAGADRLRDGLRRWYGTVQG
jgi:hypothetical protein